MDFSGIDNIQTAQSSARAQALKSLGKDDFLKLLVTQIRNQDPLKPMEGTEFTAQLAQFSSLEQLSNMSKGIDDLLLFQGSLQNTLTTDLIGKQVKVAGGTEFRTVQSVLFENGATSIVLEDGTKIRLGQIAEIKGGI